MNPLLTLAAKKTLGNKYVVTVVLAILAFWLVRGGLRKLRKKARQRRFDRNEAKDANQLAQQYRAAANPSGISWLVNTDGTDEAAIERLAYQTRGILDEVSKAYKLKFDETLSDRLRTELDGKELQDWRNIVT